MTYQCFRLVYFNDWCPLALSRGVVSSLTNQSSLPVHEFFVRVNSRRFDGSRGSVYIQHLHRETGPQGKCRQGYAMKQPVLIHIVSSICTVSVFVLLVLGVRELVNLTYNTSHTNFKVPYRNYEGPVK